jgi:hypothetical protein
MTGYVASTRVGITWRGKRKRFYVRYYDKWNRPHWKAASRKFNERPARIPEETKRMAAEITINGARPKESLGAAWAILSERMTSKATAV